MPKMESTSMSAEQCCECHLKVLQWKLKHEAHVQGGSIRQGKPSAVL